MGVCITGIGVVSAIGMSVDENLSALREGRTGIGPLHYLQGTKASLAGEVKDQFKGAFGPAFLEAYEQEVDRFDKESAHG